MTTADLAPAEAAAPRHPAMASLPYRPCSAKAGRRLVRDKLLEWELGDLVEAAELIVTELVTNALKTGCMTVMQVAIRRRTDGCVRISVRDGSRTLPVLLTAGGEEECHRGLALIDALSGGRWGADPDAHGKTVFAELVTSPPRN